MPTMKMTENSAYEMGRRGRLAGFPILNNSFSKMAFDNVVRNIGKRAAPRYVEWTHWETLWNKGWLDVDRELRLGCGEDVHL